MGKICVLKLPKNDSRIESFKNTLLNLGNGSDAIRYFEYTSKDGKHCFCVPYPNHTAFSQFDVLLWTIEVEIDDAKQDSKDGQIYPIK